MVLFNVRLFKSVTVDGKIIPETVPSIVIEEEAVAIRFAVTPSIAFFNVKRFAPRLKLPEVRFKIPSSTKLLVNETPPLRLIFKSFKEVIFDGKLNAAVPPNVRLEVVPPINSPKVAVKLPLKVSVFAPMAKLPLVNVRLLMVEFPPILTPAPLFTTTSVVTVPAGISNPVVMAEEPV